MDEKEFDECFCEYCGIALDEKTGIRKRELIQTLSSDGKVEKEEIREVWQCIDVTSCEKRIREESINSLDGVEELDGYDLIM